MADPTDPLAKLGVEVAPMFFSGTGCCGAACYKTRPVFCPLGQPDSGCSNLLPANLVWLLFWAVAKE